MPSTAVWVMTTNKETHAVQFTTVEQEPGKAEVVGKRRDRAAPARRIGVR